MDLPRLNLPLTREAALGLAVGDLVLLDGDVVITAGFPTHQRMVACLDAGKPLPLDLAGAAFVHMGICCREDGERLEPLYVNPTTSTRFNALMPTIIRRFGLTAVGGKGGLSAESVAAMREVGCVYFSIVGGASALLSASVQEIVETAWDDLIMQFRLTRIRVSGFGPVTVAIDAHGNSLYQSLQASAEARMPAILSSIRQHD
ncbi:fumarate hydratase [Phreatobacter stygius]|uniref:Fumarate hydratase n=2 Tax=Phreatobacter stygius TaxID=1940610 RepID=A0A4D7B8K3_9HYPH|nr:fumarate hydratase [Phreatobacter stygius]